MCTAEVHIPPHSWCGTVLDMPLETSDIDDCRWLAGCNVTSAQMEAVRAPDGEEMAARGGNSPLPLALPGQEDAHL